jgi:hypothetical protein
MNASTARIPSGPTGLGTSASRIPARPSRPGPSVPPLYGPGPVRIDERLAEEVDDRLVAWFEDLGIFTDRLHRLRAERYGRFVMLAHPDTADPDRLLMAARWMVALFAVDDAYTDDETAGADPELVAPRLALALAALDPPHLVGGYATRLDGALRADPVLAALRSSLEGVARSATASQVERARHESANLFVGMSTEAAWRTAGRIPPVWEYLSSRRFNSFLPAIALIDVVGGYELPADVYHDPRVHRATALAASATAIANDLYSMAKEAVPAIGGFNLPTLVAAERRCSLQEAIEVSVGYHTAVVRAFEAAHRGLAADPSYALRRFLLGLRAWIGGSNEWHASSGRYRMGGT